jgi:hypothetical protein
LFNVRMRGNNAMFASLRAIWGRLALLTIVDTFLIAGGSIITFLLLVELIAQRGGGNFLASVILGQDKRTSTSKTFIFMWTLLVGWALVSMLVVGELISIHGCVGSLTTASQVTAATSACGKINDQVGLMQIGWHNFLVSGLSGGYLVLLGVPASAAVAAKAITQSKDNSGAAPKLTAGDDQKKVAARVAQIFSADDGTTDIGDFQYMIFNLVTATFFVAEFVRPSPQGLPTIPDTLLGLTGVSAALYVGKKAATRTQPTITGIFPSIMQAGATAVITGSGLTPDSGAPAVRVTEVSINGKDAGVPQLDLIAGTVTVTVPAGLVPAGGPAISGTVQVLTAYGAVTPGFTVQLAP